MGGVLQLKPRTLGHVLYIQCYRLGLVLPTGLTTGSIMSYVPGAVTPCFITAVLYPLSFTL